MRETAFDGRVEDLYVFERARLLGYAGRLAPGEAEDLVQSAFLALLQRPDEVRVPQAWLARVARNAAYRTWSKTPSVPLDADPADEPPPALVERTAVRRAVGEALAALDERSRQAIVLRFDADRSYEQIAEALGVTDAQARVVVHRAVRRLGRALVRRFAVAHGAEGCASKLEGLAGLRSPGAERDPCARCRPVLDELAALRSMGVAPVGLVTALARRAGLIVHRIDPLVTEAAGQLAALALVLSLAIGSTPVAGGAAPVVADAPIRGPVVTTDVGPAGPSREPHAGMRSPARGSPTHDPAHVTRAGPAAIVRDDDHSQVAIEDEATIAGVVVCDPLAPCPPPPDGDGR